jgi:chromate reductase, NAD(P)H dehydrogenase (quinone)
LGVSSSLRAASANSNLLRAAAPLAPGDVRVTLYERLAALPHCNPDVEAIALPGRRRLARAAGRRGCRPDLEPQYAHGVGAS